MSKYTKKISEYLDNELDTESKSEFELLIQETPSIQKELELQKDIRKFYYNDAETLEIENNIDENKIDNIVEEVIEEYNNNEVEEFKIKSNNSYNKYKKNKFKKYIQIYSYAASFLILVFFSWYLFLNTHTLNNTELFSMYYSPYQSIHKTRSTKTDINPVIQAFNYYDNASFFKAYNILNPIVNKNNLIEVFYLGIICIELDKYTEAIKHFEYIIAKEDMLFTHHSEWYLSLCFLATSNNKEAEKMLRKIISHEGQYREKANLILESIEK